MSQNGTPEFKRKIVRIHEEEGRTYKSSGILCKGNRLGAYRFIDDYQTELGVRWLLRRLAICPSMSVYLKREGHSYSAATIHKYMNVEMGRRSIVRPQKPGAKPGKPHKVFENQLKQDFTADLAIRTLKKALDSQHIPKGRLILHSDQGSQYTSKAFIEYCESVHVAQSMSKAGYPYDNAPMERYFNTLKNECTNLYEFRTEKELYQTAEEFAYAAYNHVRPHS